MHAGVIEFEGPADAGRDTLECGHIVAVDDSSQRGALSAAVDLDPDR